MSRGLSVQQVRALGWLAAGPVSSKRLRRYVGRHYARVMAALLRAGAVEWVETGYWVAVSGADSARVSAGLIARESNEAHCNRTRAA